MEKRCPVLGCDEGAIVVARDILFSSYRDNILFLYERLLPNTHIKNIIIYERLKRI